ncbi:suppressor of cytokine signaling 7 isoform X1 [Nerophis lumbriciformis]|uniref:suppressor of cytokine signaling 7 isoform X1 n=1 Tax=Nerophis lumbriciformis TaxID=546530 RepID=UPI002AE01043|nr:suppressor of cytokine signaling 7-like isoform X1 [Nerophis lumbriciformis]
MTSDAQEMSPDFVLMRVVSAAEEDRPDADSGAVVAHSGGKASLDLGRDSGLEHPGGCRNKAPASGGGGGPAAPDSGRAPLCAPPRPQSPAEAPSCEFAPGLRPQLLVFSDLMRTGDRLNRNPLAADQSSGAGCSHLTANNNNTLDPARVQQEQNRLDGTWSTHAAVPVSAEPAELCHRPEWPLLSGGSGPLAGITRDREGAVLELARRFGELGVGGVPKMLFKAGELPQCACQGAHGPGEHADDPAVTSDALLVLEGLGSEDVAGLGLEDAQEKRDLVTCLQAQVGGPPEAHLDPQQHRVSPGEPRATVPLSHTPTRNSPWTGSPARGQLVSTPRRRPDRCASVPRTPGGADKTLKVPGKSKKGSLKIRLSRLFRTKSCSGSTHLLDKRPSMTSSVVSAGSLLDVQSTSGPVLDSDSLNQPRLTRAQSAFCPASFSSFTGETVSLVDVDISRRGTNTPHPPTPPPPPRRSLSLLDDIWGPQPGASLVSVMGASLQSLPLPLPPPAPPSHATMQHSVSLNDAFLRALPHSNPSQADAPPAARQAPPTMLCALRRSEASNFTASLRELEKCGWYWGPMNWEDAEMKLKGKPDGSFLVRDSSDPRYILSLSFRSQGVTHHTRMEHYRGTFSLWCHPKFEDRCHSVVEFIERAIMHSKNGKFLYFLRSRVPGLPPTPVQLLYPVSRFSNVKSLQHLCRFCIRQIVRIDHIQELPLPRPLISYLSKFYYYDPEEEMYLSIKSIRAALTPAREAESDT